MFKKRCSWKFFRHFLFCDGFNEYILISKISLGCWTLSKYFFRRTLVKPTCLCGWCLRSMCPGFLFVQNHHHNLRQKFCLCKTRQKVRQFCSGFFMGMQDGYRNSEALIGYLKWNLKSRYWIESTMCTSRGLFSMTTIMSWQESDSKSVSNPSKE